MLGASCPVFPFFTVWSAAEQDNFLKVEKARQRSGARISGFWVPVLKEWEVSGDSHNLLSTSYVAYGW